MYCTDFQHIFIECIAIVRAQGDKTAGKNKAQDPLFTKFVDQVIINHILFKLKTPSNCRTMLSLHRW